MQGWNGEEGVGGRLREGIYVDIQLIHFVVQLEKANNICRKQYIQLKNKNTNEKTEQDTC